MPRVDEGLLESEHVRRCWQEALALWDVRVALSPPRPLSEVRDDHWEGDEPLAYIDLETRQVVVNLPLLERAGAASALTAVLAHEIGHWRGWRSSPCSSRSCCRPSRAACSTSSSTCSNEHVGRDEAARRGLCDVYRGFSRLSDGPPSARYAFYLAIYEALWGLDDGTLLAQEHAEAMEEQFEGFRAEARVFPSTFFGLSGERLAFVYFASRFSRFLHEPLGDPLPLTADLPQPGADDLVGALRAAPGAPQRSNRTGGAAGSARRRTTPPAQGPTRLSSSSGWSVSAARVGRPTFAARRSRGCTGRSWRST